MNPRSLSKFLSLSLALSAPAALADWRDNGAFRLTQDDGYEQDSDRDYDSDEGSGSSSSGSGFALGLRAGFGIPIGDLAGTDEGDEGAKVSDLVSSVIPLQVDAGYFINSNLYVGASFQYGIGQLAEDCPESGLADTSCRATQIRFGANLAYHFAPQAKLDPWLGVGVGYEMLDIKVSVEQGDASVDTTIGVRGFEFINAQGGLDYRVSKSFSVGPYVTFTAGQYMTAKTSIETEGIPGGEDEESSEDIEEKAFHSWIYGGVRAQFRF